MRSCMIVVRSTPEEFPHGYALRVVRARKADAGSFRALATSSRAYPLEHASLENGVTVLTWVERVQNNGKR